VTAYAIYSQLPSIPGRLPSIHNMRTRHAMVTRDPPNVEVSDTRPVKVTSKHRFILQKLQTIHVNARRMVMYRERRFQLVNAACRRK
jgi:hypothetical protein